MPAVSIITVSVNNRSGLEKTLRSVTSQSFRDWEQIVVDGGSTDGSVELLRRHSGRIARWVSEKDSGIYDAMNKGLSLAVGDYCLFLPAGDRLAGDDTLSRVFAEEPRADILYGDMIIEDAQGRRRLGEMPDRITLEHMVMDTVWLPSSFIKRALFERLGPFREDLKIVSDYDFFLRAVVVEKVSTRHLRFPVAVFALGGVSSAPENAPLLRAERRGVQLRHLGAGAVRRVQLRARLARLARLWRRLFS